MKNANVVCLLAFQFALGLSSRAADWPTYMCDYTRAGHTDEMLNTPLIEQWVYVAPTQPQTAWPGPGGKIIEGLKLEHRARFDDALQVAVAEGRAYFGSSVDNTVYCLDAQSGDVQWSFITGAPVRLAPSVWQARVFVGSDDGYVYCLSADDGTLIWKLRAGPRDERLLARGRMTSRWPVRTGILVDDGVAYFGAGTFPHETVYLSAVDAETGNILWTNDTISQRRAGREDLTPQGYLLATDDLLFVPSGRTLPAAFNRHTGQMAHKQKGGGKQVGGTRAILTDRHLVSIGEQILMLNQQSGNLENRFLGQQLTLHNNMAYLADGNEIVALDRVQYAKLKERRRELEEQLSEVQRHLRRHPAPIHLRRVNEVKTKLTAAGSEYEQLQRELTEAANLYDGSRKEYNQLATRLENVKQQLREATRDGVRWRVASPHASAMILCGNQLVVGGFGEAQILDTETGQKVWSRQFNGDVRGLAAANGQLFVSTTEGEILCFGGSQRGPTSPAQALDRRQPASHPFPDDNLSPMYAKAAAQIVKQSGISSGYCLIIGSEQGRLAYELAKRTKLSIYCVESDPTKAAASQKALSSVGLYGTRVTVDHIDLSVYPHSNYFANLIVSDTLLLTGELPGDPGESIRHLKPEGGIMCLGVSDGAPEALKQKVNQTIHEWLAGTGLSERELTIRNQGGWTLAQRGPLPGAAAWTHQYGTPGNTGTVDDLRVRGGVGLLWYGDPGPSKMLNRHVGAAAPLSASGRLFVQGDESVMAYDAYNGQFLWELKNPGALRTGLYKNFEPGNLAIGDDSLFIVINNKCLDVDVETGNVRRTYTVSDTGDDNRQWGYVAYNRGLLYGTATFRELIAEEARRRGIPSEHNHTDQIFAIDTQTGERLWTYEGNSVSHTAIALDDDRLCFIDSSVTPDQREQLLRQDKTDLENLTGEARTVAEARMKQLDVRRAVALDARTGSQLWARVVDVTDCSGIGIGGGRLTMMAADGHVVLCGANANGHYWEQFLAGEFKRRRLVVLSAETGDQLWARDANYRHRPIIVGEQIIAEPWAFDLATGEQQTRIHPLTGKQTPWKFIRPGHHCGAVSATPGMLFFRSGFTGYYDLHADSGTRHFAGHRLGCWINTIPANGLVMIPEASAGCACLFSLTSTVVFEPRTDRDVWGIYSADGVTTPVQHMALNLGAPGDRRDRHGKLWLSYPRPSSLPGQNLPLDIQPMSNFGTVGSFFQHNSQSYAIADADIPWVFTSGMQGMTRCQLPLIGAGEQPANYTVRLYFAAPDGDEQGVRIFDVRLQGEIAFEKLDVVTRAAGSRRALILEKEHVPVTRDLVVELVPRHRQPAASRLPILCGIEVLRAGENEILRNVAAR